jgi:methyltransferase
MVSALYPALLVLLGMERFVELVLSRRHARRAFARGGVELGRGHFPVMVVFHTAFLAACAAHAFLYPRADPAPAVWGPALAGAIAAQALRYWAIVTLGDRWNVRIIVLPGAAPVVGGPYRWVRHPNYVAVAVETACVPLVHGAWLLALGFSLGNAMLLWVRIRAEEAALGEHYRTAFAVTPRFLPNGRR